MLNITDEKPAEVLTGTDDTTYHDARSLGRERLHQARVDSKLSVVPDAAMVPLGEV